MEDNKLTNVDSKVNDNILGKIKCHFGYLSIQRGRKLWLLGIDITFIPDVSVSIEIEKYLRDTISMFPGDILGPAPLHA